MNEDQFGDLKQFIDSRISQSEASLDSSVDEKLESLRKDMLDGFSGVVEAIDEINKQIDERLTKLEQTR